MRKLSLNDVVRRIVGVALASSVGVSTYGCLSGNTVSEAPVDAGGTDGSLAADAPNAEGGDAGNPFADEDTFMCVDPLPGVLDALTPAMPVDYVELRNESWIRGTDGGAVGTPQTVASHGTACASAADKPACTSALAALGLQNDNDGWLVDGDVLGPPPPPGYPQTKQLLVFTRGDQVGAARNPADVKTFLGTIGTMAEARLVVQTRNQTLVCTTTPHKSGYRTNADGSFELIIVGKGCGTLIDYRYRYRVDKNGTVTKTAAEPVGNPCGRRPEGLRREPFEPSAWPNALTLADHLALAAHLEAASVIAFRRLELELRRFGAPASFARRAERARVDEIHHARDTAALARRFGGVVAAVDVAPMAVRDLFAFALENAVEGAVRETYGALVAAFQAQRAAPELRPLYRRIARDEARHAELAHDIDRWVQPKLTADERARVATARAVALEQLRVAIATEPSPTVVTIAGVPTAGEARILLDGLARELLAAA